VYDNSDTNVLKHLTEKYAPFVDVIAYPRKQPQVAAYNDCVQRFKRDPSVWIAFFDVDEFLVLKKHDTITSFIEQYKAHPGIVIHWLYFGNSGLLTYTKEPMTKRFVHRQREGVHPLKSIVNAASVEKMDVHTATYTKGAVAVNTSLAPMRGGDITDVPIGVAHLNHYYFKTLDEFKRKKSRTDAVFQQKPLDYSLQCTNENLYGVPIEDFDKTKCLEMYNGHIVPHNEVFDVSASNVYTQAQKRFHERTIGAGHSSLSSVGVGAGDSSKRHRLAYGLAIAFAVMFCLLLLIYCVVHHRSTRLRNV
jgi:hypothetical protein